MLSQISQSDSEKLEGKNKVKGVSFQNEKKIFFDAIHKIIQICKNFNTQICTITPTPKDIILGNSSFAKFNSWIHHHYSYIKNCKQIWMI